MKVGYLLPSLPEIQSIVRSFHFPNLELFNLANSDDVVFAEIEALLYFNSTFDMKKAHKLRFVQLLSSGSDILDLTELKRRKILVADNNGTNSTAVAEHTLLLMLATLRQLTTLQKTLREGNWQGPPPFIADLRELEGKRVGIVGFGRIGKKVAQRVHGFGAFAQAFDIDENIQPPDFVQKVSLKELFFSSDIITFHVPYNRSTHYLFNMKVLSKLKNRVVIINTSRGKVVQEEAILSGLKSGKIIGCGLDVFETEPYNGSLLHHSQVVATPHRAGSSNENWSTRIYFGLENIFRFASGQQPMALL